MDEIASLENQINSRKNQILQIKEQLSHVLPDDLKYIDYQVRLNAVQQELEKLQLERINKIAPKDFEFANRRDELKELGKTNFNRFFQIYAPAGYGKTRLLQRLRTLYSSKKFATAFVDFSQPENEGGLTDRGEALNCLLRSVGAETSGSLHKKFDHFSEKLLSLVELNHRVKVVLFLDSIEKVDKEVLFWLVETIIQDLKQRRMIKDIFGFFASRYKIDLNLGLKYKPYPLSHFERDDIDEVINSRYKGRMSVEDKDLLIPNILELCLGHPKCVFGILDEIGSVPKYDDNNRFVNFEELFCSIVKPIVHNEILKYAIKYVDEDVLKSLFAIRSIFPSDLAALFDEDIALNGYDLSTMKSTQELVLFKLPKTGLFYPPTIYKPGYCGDPIVRYVIMQEMLYENPPRFERIHTKAFHYYKQRALSDKSISGITQISQFVEAIYHLVRTFLLRNTIDGNQEAVITEIAMWKPEWRTGGTMRMEDYQSEFIRLINEDTDLPLLLNITLGEKGYTALIGFINSPFAGEEG